MTDTGNIRDYFAGKHVFLTGGTGFIGKVLIEKLLQSCPTIGGIHCLVRPKKGHHPRERLNAIFQEKMFETLHKENPEFPQKVHPVSGDVLAPDLGMSTEDTQHLQQTINVVIHSAATLKFDEFIRLALEMNVLGVRKMIKFAKGMPRLDVFLHVSTAYANCDRVDIEEVFYPPKVHPDKVAGILSWMDDETLGILTDKIIGDKPNTYTYTKQLAEWVLLEEASDLPVAIVRPSIVTGSLAQPIPGWVDNWNGPSGLYIALGKGFLKSMRGDSQAIADIVPVDMLVNAMIAVAWSTAQSKPDRVNIYNVTTGGLNPIKWGSMESILVQCLKRVPLEDAIGLPEVVLTKNSVLHTCYVYAYHWAPAFFIDTCLRIIGRRPKMTRLYEKLHKSLSVLDYFTLHSWNWSNENILSLQDALQPEDKEVFYFDPRVINWSDYVMNYLKGVKSFILRENIDDTRRAKKRMYQLFLLRIFFRLVWYCILLRLILAKSETGKTWLLSTLSMLQRWFTGSG